MSAPREACAAIAVTQKERPLARLTDLLWEVRAIAREAVRAATERSAGSGGHFEECLVSVFDTWMATRTGRDLLLCFVAGLEHGLVLERHIPRCMTSLCETGSIDARTLFWVGMRRVAASRGRRVA
ncbi:hypothetical protein BKK79_21050 [Cupriavidus sp. USMAA2-4]|uniref:hypothetical protein n=1 Tax=Cupriavidus sp. USMAA2-4 TaxID=876364 RepID=UPI0008A6F2E7|nr:hypothetical protein [Cupriavidus sp. USMAA2-4]AOY94439.1 hypothetical protein BKK79_21050 [Cupriavidus sp. USMAA2-4]